MSYVGYLHAHPKRDCGNDTSQMGIGLPKFPWYSFLVLEVGLRMIKVHHPGSCLVFAMHLRLIPWGVNDKTRHVAALHVYIQTDYFLNDSIKMQHWNLILV